MKTALLLLAAVGAAFAQPSAQTPAQPFAQPSAQTPAEELIVAGHWKRARAIVEPRLRDAPNDPLALFLTSQIRFAFGDSETPMQFAEKALALDGNVAKYHRQVAEIAGVMAQHANLFQVLVLARRFKSEIDAAIALDPKNIQAQRDLMEYYLIAPGLAGGNKTAAHDVAERIGRIDRAEGYSAEARLAVVEKDMSKAEALLRKAVAAAPDSYKAHIELAQFALVKEHLNLETAESEAREALRIDATRVAAYSALAEVYASREKWADLDELLAKADEAVPDDLTPHYRAAETMLRAGKNFNAARKNLNKYLTQEREGNEPAAADAREKLALAQPGGPRPQ